MCLTKTGAGPPPLPGISEIDTSREVDSPPSIHQIYDLYGKETHYKEERKESEIRDHEENGSHLLLFNQVPSTSPTHFLLQLSGLTLCSSPHLPCDLAFVLLVLGPIYS